MRESHSRACTEHDPPRIPGVLQVLSVRAPDGQPVFPCIAETWILSPDSKMHCETISLPGKRAGQSQPIFLEKHAWLRLSLTHLGLWRARGQFPGQPSPPSPALQPACFLSPPSALTSGPPDHLFLGLTGSTSAAQPRPCSCSETAAGLTSRLRLSRGVGTTPDTPPLQACGASSGPHLSLAGRLLSPRDLDSSPSCRRCPSLNPRCCPVLASPRGSHLLFSKEMFFKLLSFSLLRKPGGRQSCGVSGATAPHRARGRAASSREASLPLPPPPLLTLSSLQAVPARPSSAGRPGGPSRSSLPWPLATLALTAP